MSNNKQSSVEWYAEKEHEIAREFVMANINHVEYFAKKRELQEQAKVMHKEEMKDAVLSQCTTNEGLRKIFENQFEQYYNETYGGNNE